MGTNNDANQPPPVPVPLMNLQPGKVNSWCKMTPTGHVIIHFEHSTGTTSLIVDEGFAKALINQLQQVTGGLVVPKLDGA